MKDNISNWTLCFLFICWNVYRRDYRAVIQDPNGAPGDGVLRPIPYAKSSVRNPVIIILKFLEINFRID